MVGSIDSKLGTVQINPYHREILRRVINASGKWAGTEPRYVLTGADAPLAQAKNNYTPFF